MAGECVNSNICRLCMNTGALKDIFQMEGTTNIYMKIISCLDIKIQIHDGLPEVICEVCEKIIQDFYDFKHKCSEIDSELRSMNNPTKSPTMECPFSDFDSEHIRLDIKFDSEYLTTLDNDFKKLDDWLSDDETCNKYLKYPSNDKTDKDILVNQNENCDEVKIKKIVNSLNCNIKASNKRKPKVSSTTQCEFCGRTFKKKSLLAQHLVQHTGEKRYSCNICSKKFTREENRTVHMRSHLGIRPYICNTCGKSSRKRQDLLRHLRIHSDVRNYKCPFCERKFKRSGDVHSHMRSHTKERPYGCKSCDKTYSSHSGLTKHHKTTNCKTKEI